PEGRQVLRPSGATIIFLRWIQGLTPLAIECRPSGAMTYAEIERRRSALLLLRLLEHLRPPVLDLLEPRVRLLLLLGRLAPAARRPAAASASSAGAASAPPRSPAAG